MSRLVLLGIDPGLRTSGLCWLDAECNVLEQTNVKCSGDRDWHAMAAGIIESVDVRELAGAVGKPDAIGIEDFVFRAPKISHGMVKHAAAQGKLIGCLYEALRLRYHRHPPFLIPAHKSKQDQPKDAKMAKALGIPGRNEHERDAYYVALWLRGTMRFERRPA